MFCDIHPMLNAAKAGAVLCGLVAMNCAAGQPGPRAAPVTAAEGEPGRPNLIVHPYGRYLFRPNGQPFFYLADTCWELFHRATLEDAQRYLDDRAAKGFTVVQATMISEMDGLDDPNRQGQVPFLDRDPSRPNPAYFELVEQMITMANQRGLVVGALPAWGDRFHSPGDPSQEVFTPDNARRYGRYLGQRFRDHDLVWILGGGRDPQDDTDRAIVIALAQGLQEGDLGRHLITYHPRRGSSSGDFFHRQPWLAFNMYQTGHEAPNMPESSFMAEEIERNPAKPALDGEAAYEDHPYNWDPSRPRFSPYFVRKLAYQALTAGAAGHAYGHNSVWQMWERGRTPWSEVSTGWQTALDAPGARQVGALRKLVDARPFERLLPDSKLIVGRSEDDVESAALADDGSFAFIYSPIGRPVTIDLSRFRSTAVVATLWDPRTGTAQSLGRFPTQGPQVFSFGVTDPGRDRDHLLLLDAEDAGFPAPGVAYPRPRAAPGKGVAQRLLLDGVFAFRDDGFLTDVVPPDPPSSWTEPVDYRAGTLHLRVEVKQLPRKADTTSLLFRIGSGTHQDRTQVIVYGSGTVLFDKPGVYRHALPIASHQLLVPNGQFSWQSKPKFLQVAVADAQGHRISKWEQDLAKFEGDMKKHLPLKARVTAFVVPAGQQFQAPAYW
jgi:hypothetical protein